MTEMDIMMFLARAIDAGLDYPQFTVACADKTQTLVFRFRAHDADERVVSIHRSVTREEIEAAQPGVDIAAMTLGLMEEEIANVRAVR